MEPSRTLQAKPSIAVVDDDPSVLRSLGRLLSSHGFDVTAYSSAASLLADVESLQPECVIADLAMPGVNGLDLQATLAEREPRCPIVFLTGLGDVRSSVRAMRAGAVDFLANPSSRTSCLQRSGAPSRLAASRATGANRCLSSAIGSHR